MLDNYETTREAARRLGHHPSYICACARKGRLRAVKRGTQWFVYRGAEIDEPLPDVVDVSEPWPYISAAELAEHWEKSDTYVRNLCQRGEIPAFEMTHKRWRAWLIPRGVLEA